MSGQLRPSSPESHAASAMASTSENGINRVITLGFTKVFEFVRHDSADGDADAAGVGAADDFEQAAARAVSFSTNKRYFGSRPAWWMRFGKS